MAASAKREPTPLEALLDPRFPERLQNDLERFRAAFVTRTRRRGGGETALRYERVAKRLPKTARDLSLVAGYVRALLYQRNLSEHTATAYLGDLKRFLLFCAARGVELRRAAWRHVQDFVAECIVLGESKTTAARRLAAVRSFYRHVVKWEGLESNPAAIVTPPKRGRPLPRVIKPSQLDVLLSLPPSDDPWSVRDAAIMELLYASGIRVGELCALDLDDVDLRRFTVRVLGKGRKERVVPLGEHGTAAVRRYLAEARPQIRRAVEAAGRSPEPAAVFLNARGGRLGQRSARAIVARYAHEAVPGSRVSPHTFRHTYATHLLDGGADLVTVKELLGHVDLRTTQIYTHVSKERLKKAYDMAHPRASR